MNKEVILAKTKELVAAPSCFGELKNLANDWMNSIGKADENEKFNKYIEYLKGSVTPIDSCISFLESDMGKQIYGDKIDETIKFAKDRKNAGEDTCICAACQAGKAILASIK